MMQIVSSERSQGSGTTRPPRGTGDADNVIPIRGTAEHATRVIAVTSGKGGVGKSVLSANLGICLARRERKVLLVDADLALANLDLMLGVTARSTVRDMLTGSMSAEQVMVQGPHGVTLLPACSGDLTLADMSDQGRMAVFDSIDALAPRFDTVVIDTGAGIGSNSTAFAAAAQQTLVVVTPDPASIADGYAMIKVLSQRCGLKRLYLAINMASGPQEADAVLQRILGLVHQFLDVSVIPVGYVYHDSAVERSVRSCQPLVTTFPRAAVSSSLQALAGRLLDEEPPQTGWGGPRLFWRKLIGLSEEGQDK